MCNDGIILNVQQDGVDLLLCVYFMMMTMMCDDDDDDDDDDEVLRCYYMVYGNASLLEIMHDFQLLHKIDDLTLYNIYIYTTNQAKDLCWPQCAIKGYFSSPPSVAPSPTYLC